MTIFCGICEAKNPKNNVFYHADKEFKKMSVFVENIFRKTVYKLKALWYNYNR